MKCSKCKGTDCNLSRRNTIERTVGYLLPARPYRCSACHMRFWGLDRSKFTIGRIIFAGLSLFLLLWFLIGLIILAKEQLTTQLTTQVSNLVPTKENTSTATKVETNETTGASVALQEQRDVQGVSSAVDLPVLEATHSPPINDFVKVLSERNKESRAALSVESIIPKKKPLAGSLRLEQIRLKSTSVITLVLHANRRIKNHTFFRLEEPARIVVDLPGKWTLSVHVPLQLIVDAGLVEKIRLGKNSENLRIVFDLGATRVKAPLFDSKANSLEITLTAS